LSEPKMNPDATYEMSSERNKLAVRVRADGPSRTKLPNQQQRFRSRRMGRRARGVRAVWIRLFP